MDQRTRKIILVLLIILTILGLLLSVFLFVMLFLKNKSFSFLQDTISKQATLQAKTVDTWGNYTDAKNVKIINQLRFYDYKGQQDDKFIVQETPYVQLREHHLVHNLQYHHKNEFVDYFRQITRVPDGNSQKFEAKFPNFLGIFFWNKIQNLPQEERTWMALSGLMGKLVDNEFFKKQIQSTTLWDQLKFNSYTFVKGTILTGLDLNEQQMQMIHSDQLYGLGTKQGIFKWIQYIDLEKQKNENLLNIQYQLKNYFQIKLSQVQSISQKILPIIKELEEAFKTEFICKNYCTSQEIFNKQWSQSQLSLKFLQQDTIADNKEIFGFLEYNKFYNEKFKNKEQYKDAYMDVEQTENLLAIDIDQFTSAKRWDTLVHKTNIKEFLQIGKVYEQTSNENVFTEIVQRFKLKNIYQAVVIYEYLKYMGNEFLLMNDLNGNMEITALTNVGAEYFERYFNNTTEFFKNHLFKATFIGVLNELNTNCQNLLKNSIPFLKNEKLDSICNKYDQQNDFIGDLYITCESGQQTNINELNKVQINMLCEQQSNNQQSYFYIKQKYLQGMAEMYKIDLQDVSPENFVVLQFLNGSITQTVNKYINDKYPVSDSIQTWMSDKFRNKIELKTYAINTNQQEQFQEYNQKKLKKLMSISGWFNGVVVQRAVLTCLQGDMSYLKEHFDLENFEFFFNYLKFFMKEVIVGGDYINVNQDDGINGVVSPFLKEFAEKQVLKGGDPSIPYKFQILKPKEQATIQKNTGMLNYRLTDSYVMFQDKPYIPSQPQPYFNGNTTTELFLNPYEEEIRLQGFELQSNPFTIKDNLKNPEEKHIPPSKDNFVLYFVEAIGRIIKLKYQETVDLGYHNFIGYRYEIDDNEFSNNDFNKKTYDQNINGFFNGTSVLGGPVYISRNRFYGVQETEIGNVQILDDKGNKVIAQKEVDNLWVNSEKYTGCGVNINVNLQINMKIDKNILFDPLFNNNNTLYPLFNIHVTVNFEDEQYNNVLSDLKLPYNIFNHYILYIVLFMLLFIILTLSCLFGVYKLKNNKNEDSSILIDENKTEGLIL